VGGEEWVVIKGGDEGWCLVILLVNSDTFDGDW
jgi:hypothetical protein